MSIFSFFLKKSKSGKLAGFETSDSNEFADKISVELKTSAAAAIKLALESKEGKYLRSILEESFFPLESLIFIPVDLDTSKLVEEFFRVHQAIDKNFKKNFLREILQSEYRSSRGGSVLVSKNFTSEIQIDEKSVENKSAEESFQISLRGRKILFRAIATLGIPIKKEENIELDTLEFNRGVLESDNKIPRFGNFLISDSNGHRNLNVNLPAMIGRNKGENYLSHGVNAIMVDAKYVSRKQLFVFHLMEDILCFVPEAASLTCQTLSGKKLVPGQIHKIETGKGERFYFGIPLDHDGPMTGNTDPSQFPVIEINFNNTSKTLSGTPRPKIQR